MITEPGFYYLTDGMNEQAVAFNIATSESLTDTIGVDEWERLGVPLKPLQDETVEPSVRRQRRDVELEQNQAFWQWMVVAVIALLAIEGLIRGLIDRRPTALDA